MSSGGTKKGKILVVFFGLTSFRRVWFRPENGTFLQILGVPTGKKTRRNEENMSKRRLSEVGHESFFLRKFRFSCPFGVKKAAIPRPGNVYTRGVHGVAYELLSRNPKSGYFVYNFDTKSVKLGFKNWLKNPPIFPISGGPVPFRTSLRKIMTYVKNMLYDGEGSTSAREG